MYIVKRPLLRSLFLLIVASFLFGACSTPLPSGNWPGLSTDGQNVYVAYGSRVLAYNVETKSQVWQFPAEVTKAQFFAAPSVTDGRIILGDFGAAGGAFSPSHIVTIYALPNSTSNAPTPLWTNNTVAHDRILAAPLQVGDQVFIGTADDHLLALNAQTGELLWDFATEHSIWAQPTYSDGTLFVASLDKNVYALDAESGNLKWKTTLGGALASPAVVGSSLVYISGFDRQIHALDIADGQEKWTASSDDWSWSAPILDGDTLYFTDVKGNVYAISATDGRQKWKANVGSVIIAQPVVNDGTVYIAAEGDKTVTPVLGTLTALSTEDGSQKWQKTTPASVYSTPVVVGDTLVIALSSQTELLVGYHLADGEQAWMLAPPAN